MSVFYRDIDVKIYLKENKAELSKPLIVYQGDFGLEIYFRLLEYETKFKKDGIDLLEDLSGAYANITLVNPKGYQINIPDIEIVNDKVKFVITKDLTDELDEVGIYKMQIHIGNVEGEADTSSFSIPEFEFEVRKRLTGITDTGLTDSEGYTLTDSENYTLDNNSTKKIINYTADKINSILSKADDTELNILSISDTVNILNKHYQYLDVTQNCTLALPSLTSYFNIELSIKMSGDYTITFPEAIKWQVDTDFTGIINAAEFTVILSYINSSWKGGIVYYA